MGKGLPYLALLLAGACDCASAFEGGAPRSVARTRELAADLMPHVLRNGLASNGLLADLGSVALTEAGLAENPELQALVEHDPAVQGLMSYIVSCALPRGTSLTVGGVTFEGDGGLAPEWAEGPCETACQEWVSACLMARTNVYEIPVMIYTRGPHPTLSEVPAAEDELFGVIEGAFYGNLFEDPPREYACRGPGYDPLASTFRVCAQRGNRCGIQHVGACGAIDGDTGEATERHACDGIDSAAGGGYVRCRDRASLPGSDAYPEGARTYERVITVSLRRSLFAGAVDTADGRCADGPPPPAPTPAEPAGGAGAACDNDDDCDVGRGLFCDARQPPGVCTKSCTQRGDLGSEAEACGGPGSTCLGPEGASFCTASCTPGDGSDTCGPGMVCTSMWFARAVPDRPGCSPLCSADAHCPLGMGCTPSGACRPSIPAEALPDGAPCTLPPVGGTPEVPCEGVCFRTSNEDPTKGICGSVVDRTTTDGCADPNILMQGPEDDDVGLCVFRSCESDADCTAPLVCVSSFGGARCDHASP